MNLNTLIIICEAHGVGIQITDDENAERSYNSRVSNQRTQLTVMAA